MNSVELEARGWFRLGFSVKPDIGIYRGHRRAKAWYYVGAEGRPTLGVRRIKLHKVHPRNIDLSIWIILRGCVDFGLAILRNEGVEVGKVRAGKFV